MARSERLSPVEAIMWRVGHDATLRMTVGTLTVLDRAPDLQALFDRFTVASEQAPRLRWRLDDPSRLRARPAWVDDRPFDPAAHVRRLAVPTPGSLRQVLDLVEMLEHHPFDPERSPWDATVIEGLDGGRVALYLRADHVLTDGMGGMSLIDLLFDEHSWRTRLQPEVVAQADVVVETTPADVVDDLSDAEPDEADAPARRPGTLSLTVDLTAAARPVAAGLAAGVGAARNIDPLDTLVRTVQRSIDVVNSVSRQVVVTGGPLSPIFAGHPATSRFEVISLPGARAAAIALGGSRNDLLVAAAAAALGAYHDHLGLPCEELRMAMPASRRRDQSTGGNWFALTRVEIPTASDHPAPQFGVVSERLARARNEPAVRFTGALAGAINRLPTRLLIPALHAQASSVDFVATAVPGFRGQRHICGATVEGSYPFGPRLGCLVNIAAFGNNDRLDVGIALDPTAIAEPDFLLEVFRTAFARYVPALRASAPVPVAASEPLAAPGPSAAPAASAPAPTPAPASAEASADLTRERAGRPSA